MSTLLICNAQIVNEGSIQKADVFIREGRIARIDSDLSHLPSDQFIDASGLYLLPGMIDSQFTIVGNVTPSKLEQECSAAVAGGVTSILLLPDLSKQTDEEVYLVADDLDTFSGSLKNNLAYYQAVKVSELEMLQEMDFNHCCGVYVSMSNAYDAYRFDGQDALEVLLDKSPVLVAVHAESAPIIIESEESYRQIYGDEIPFNLHSSIHSQAACSVAAEEVLTLAAINQSRLHLLHVSSAAEVELLESYRANNKNISADVCSLFLTFSDSDCVEKGGQLKCTPAIKTDIDRAALMQGLLDNNIDNICSGHIPISLEDKEGSYFAIPSGQPQVQLSLPSVLEHFQDQILSLESVVQKVSHAVADCFNIKDRGYIREGYWADLVLVDVEGSFIARNEDMISGAGWTVFHGNEFRSSVITTVVNGRVVWTNDALVDAPSVGQLIDFDRS